VPLSIAIEMLWDTPWWHSAAKTIMGV